MSRTITSSHAGPAQFVLRIPAGQVSVTADSGTRHATVTLRPVNPADEVAGKGVEDAEVHDQGERLEVTVPAFGAAGGRGTRAVITGGGNITVVSSSRGINVVSGNNIVVSGNGVVVGGGGSVVINGGTGVFADVFLPAGSSVRINAVAADVRTQGALALVEVESDSGDVTIGQANTVEATTGSGDVIVTEAGTITARTGSGDVQVEAGARVDLRTGSGDVTVRTLSGRGQIRTGSGDVRVRTQTADLSVTTGSGDIKVRAAAGVSVNRNDLRTGSGDVKVH